MTKVFGFYDGLKGDDLYGWAWHPEAPDEPVIVEVSVDGVVAGEVAATHYRPDLRSAGVGHGRYGWRFPLSAAMLRGGCHDIVARTKHGDPLIDGTFVLDLEPPAADFENPAFQAFISAVRRGGERPTKVLPKVAARPFHFFLHCPVPLGKGTMGQPEYSYGFVMRAFQPVLEQLGTVHVVSDIEEVDAHFVDRLLAGENGVLFSFAPPHQTPLGLRCPVVPVIAWEFPDFPVVPWDEEHRNDWRFPLRQAGRAITLSSYATAAIRAVMGANFPVATVPTASFDRLPEALPPPARSDVRTVSLDGFVYDTRGRHYAPGTAVPPIPSEAGPGRSVTLEGVVYTSVFSPRDGRKNWMETVRAFLVAHAEDADATFVLKMIGPDAAHWWWELHDILNASRPFRCRVVVLQGYLEDAEFQALIAATHWVVNASHAEGLCMPLLEFMSGARPAIAPGHTAMADYVRPENAIVIASEEEYCGWPQDPRHDLISTRHRVSWSGTVDAMREAYRITMQDADQYRAMSSAARETMRAYCSDASIRDKLQSFLGLSPIEGAALRSPSRLHRDIAAR